MSTNGMEKNLVLDFATRCPSELSGAFSASSRADSNCWHKSASFVVLPRRLLQKPLNLSYSCMRRKHWWSHKIDAICCYQCIRLTADAILRNTKNVALLLGCVDLLCICLFLRLIGLRIRGFFHLAKPLELNIVFGNLRFEWAAAWSIYYAKAWTVTGMRASVSCWVCRSSIFGQLLITLLKHHIVFFQLLVVAITPWIEHVYILKLIYIYNGNLLARTGMGKTIIDKCCFSKTGVNMQESFLTRRSQLPGFSQYSIAPLM